LEMCTTLYVRKTRRDIKHHVISSNMKSKGIGKSMKIWSVSQSKSKGTKERNHNSLGDILVTAAVAAVLGSFVGAGRAFITCLVVGTI